MFPTVLALPRTESVESAEPWKGPSASINPVLCDCYLLFNIEPRTEAGKQAPSHQAVSCPSVTRLQASMVLLALSPLWGRM